MTPRQADKIIALGKPVTVRDRYGDTFTATFVARDRWSISTNDGGKFDRGDLELVN